MGVERIAHPFGPMTRNPTIASSNLPARATTHAAICLILCLVALPLRASVSVEKTPSDVFLNMQRISLLLDTVPGSAGFTPDDVFREVLTIREEPILISEALDESIPRTVWQDVPFRPETEPGDVLVKAREVLGLILEAKRRAGMFNLRNIATRPESVVTPSDVFNQVRLIETELTELKVFLGIDTLPPRPPKQEGKSPAHVLQMLEGITGALRIFLHREQA